MRLLWLLVALCTAFYGMAADARGRDTKFYQDNISSLYKSSEATARIEITGFTLIKVIRGMDMATGKAIGPIGYRTYRIKFRLIETYKGRIKSSSPFTMSIEYPGKPPLGEFIASFESDGKGSYYLADDSQFMVPARPELVKFARSLK